MATLLDDPKRCGQWERRWVRGNEHTSQMTKQVSVRCVQNKNHKGDHTWRGISFGVRKHRTAAFFCGAINRRDGHPCRHRVWNEGDRCPDHR